MSNAQHVAFGPIVKERRRALDLTQAELARRVACATITIRKIEADDAHPSQQIIERLAMALNVPLAERAQFVQLARAAAMADRSPLPTLPTPPPMPEEIGQEDLSGRAIRGYELGERLGAGSFGAVYRAVQPHLEREVAVKIILPQYADHPEFIRRFEAEAQLVARIEHPYIVPLYDYWREPGVAYLVMRFLRGGSLKDRLESGPLDLPTAGRLLEQVGAALHAAHRVGVVHRDLKPANVLLDEEGNGYLADFGIAKNLSDPQLADLTQAGAIIGSPAYVSPEQILAEPVQPQADIYALGLLLYELLAGELPFHGPTPMDYIRQHLEESPPPLAGYPALDSVVRRATARLPGERYPDIPALLADFRQAISPSVGVLAAVPHAVEAGPVALENPYKGLRPFGEADAPDFFGRDTLVQELLGALAEAQDDSAGPRQELARFLAIVGPSGSGKSSVVEAGLLPALRRGGILGAEKWFIVDMQPGTHPWEELEAALLRIAVNPPESLLAQLQEGPRGLLRAVRRVLPADPAVELLLVIDQFEELFTQVTDEEVRAAFLGALVTAALDAHSRVRIVVTLRADFVGRALEYVDLGELLRQRAVYVLPLTPEELEQAIVGPAGRAGAAVEPGLLAAIVQDVGDQPGMLPLLQYALTELFDRRQGRTMTLAVYRESGGVAGALGRRAEELYAQLDEGGREAARQLFLRLVTLGEGSADTRRRVLQAEVEGVLGPHPSPPTPSPLSPNGERGEGVPPKAAGERGEGVSPVLALFGRHRLLTFDHDPLTRGPTVEVAHEALLREWGRLRGWLESSRADVRLERMLGAAAGEWEGAGREPSYLLQGARLSQFEGWAESTTLALTAGEREFLAASVAGRQDAEEAEKARREHELQTALQLAETEKARAAEQERRAEVEKRRAEEQGRHARRLRQRAFLLTGALVIAAVLAALALFFGQSANRSAQEAGRNLNAAQTAQVQAVAEAGVRATAQAVAETQQAVAQDEAYARATQQAIAEGAAHARATAEAVALANLNHSEAMRLAGEANQLLLQEDNPEVAALLALQSLGMEYTPQGDAALEGALQFNYPVRTYTGVGGLVVDAAFSPDGQSIVATTMDGRLLLWDVATAQQVRQFTGHTGFVTSVAFSPDGRRLVSGGDDKTLRFWDLATGQELARMENPASIYDVDYSPDGRYVASGDTAGTVRLWEAATGTEVRAMTSPAAVYSLAFSPDGRFLASGGLDSGSLDSGGDDRLRLWDVATGQLFASWDMADYSYALAFAPDGRTLFTAGDLAHQWDVASGQEVQRFVYPEQSVPLHGLGVSPDGQYLLSSCGQIVLLWNLATHQEVGRYITPVYSFATVFAPDGRTLATGSGIGTVRLWEVAPVSGLPRISPPGGTLGVAFSSDGQTIATGYTEPVQLWDARTGDLVQELPTAGVVATLSFSPDDRTLFITFWDPSASRVELWDVAGGTRLFTATEGFSDLFGDFAPDGRSTVTVGDAPRAVVWDVAIGERRLVIDLPVYADHVVYAPDGATFLTSSQSESVARRWNAVTGEQVGAFAVDPDRYGPLGGIAFSPDGRYVAAGSNDGTLWLWDAATGQEVRRFKGHLGTVWNVVFSPDGRSIASGGYDQTARLWDTATGRELRRFTFPSATSGIVFSPDGRVLVETGEGTPLKLWYTDINDSIADLCGRMLRDLTDEERAQYGVGEGATCPLEVER